jgi:hypothetical protein
VPPMPSISLADSPLFQPSSHLSEALSPGFVDKFHAEDDDDGRQEDRPIRFFFSGFIPYSAKWNPR